MSDSTSPKPATDLNLLFGLLALQLDFITKEGLLAAMHAWLLEKQTPLADLLVRTGALSADRRLLLEALVREHLKQHGDDPQQSLASLSSVDAAKLQLGQLADPDLQASLAPLLSSPVLSMSSTQSVITKDSADDTPENTERFRVLRYHAEGGLGQVWVAEDSELHREVALKVIQPKKAHEASHQTRFVLEAEITGGLEHPGIVPVYGLGHYADGRPFYAMKFIRGDSLKTAITAFHQRFADSATFDPAAWNLELRKLLQRFLDVCNTVAYAHSRGVLHRDLKPGNVMIGKYGETLVVDWGLAKAVGERVADVTHPDEATLHPATSDSYETASGSAIGTPAYMPPEQAAGRLTELGPHSDVYSLGATLYHLLTNRAPFEGTTKEILDRVIAGGVMPPHARSRRVPLGLSAICVKAMQRQPSGRYVSPRDLAQDVERWLADEAITARRDGIVTSVRRWVRRHQTLATSVVVALTLILSIIAGSRYVANQELARLRADAEARLSEADTCLSNRDYVRGTNLIHGLQARLEEHATLSDLAARAQIKLDQLQRFISAEQRLQDFRRSSEAASRFGATSDPRRVPEALSHFEAAFAALGVLDGSGWTTSELMSAYSPELQKQLVEEAHFLTQQFVELQYRTGSRSTRATGLGFMVSLSNRKSLNSVRVALIVPDSPAEKAGLRAGDRLFEIAEQSTLEFTSSEQIRNQLIGPPNSLLELLVKRQGNALEKLSLIRSAEGRTGIAAKPFSFLVIESIEKDSPASKVGIRPGDLLIDIGNVAAEGEVLIDAQSVSVSPLDSLVRNLGATTKATSCHLTIWRPTDRTILEFDLPWERHRAVTFEWFHHWLLKRNIRQEYGAFQYALKSRAESLLKNLGVDDPERPLFEVIVHAFIRRGWPEAFVREVLTEIETEFRNAPELREGMDLMVEGKFMAATNALLKHVERHPNDADGWMLLMLSLDRIKRWEAMIEVCTNYISRRPLEAVGYYNRAVAYRRVGELTLARRDIEHALQLNPDEKEAEAVLKDIEAAEAVMKKAAETKSPK